MKNEIPIVFAANNDYVPYLGVALSSLIACANVKNSYSIFILHTSISKHNQERLEALSTFNINIRCKDVKYEMEGRKNISFNILTVETTYRLFIPELFSHYDKVLYLDSDLVAIKDVAELYNIDIGNSMLGAAREIQHEKGEDYIRSLCDDIIIDDYFNAGVLLINTKQFTKNEIKNKCFELLYNEVVYKYLDQDVLNITCRGNVTFLDERWNCCYYNWFPSCKPVPEKEKLFLQIAEDPWILHFNSQWKPWLVPEAKYANYFWKYARETVFYEEILYKNAMREATDVFKNYLLPFECMPFGSKVVLYGGGQVGQAFQKQIEVTNLYKLVVWIDNNYTKLRDEGYAIENPKSLFKYDFDFILVSVYDKNTSNVIINSLIDIGVDSHKIIWADPRHAARWANWNKNTIDRKV